jgi:2,3-diaminopropionate biosynthesis protein SbnA
LQGSEPLNKVTGQTLSIVCAVKGYEFICVTDPNILPQTRRLIEAYGARIVIADRRDPKGGFLATRIELIKEWLKRDPDLLWLNQYANQANAAAHERWTGPEILRNVPDVDHVFVGAGTTGTLVGCSRYIRKHRPQAKIIAVDTAGSVTFGSPAGLRYLPGLGTSRRPELADESAAEEIVWIAEEETILTCRRLARRTGLLVGASTGTVVAAIERYRERIPKASTVVAISPDLGDRYVDTLYDCKWVDERFPKVVGKHDLGAGTVSASVARAASRPRTARFG